MTRVCVIVAMLMALSACETVQGVGQDISNAGQALERAVN